MTKTRLFFAAAVLALAGCGKEASQPAEQRATVVEPAARPVSKDGPTEPDPNEPTKGPVHTDPPPIGTDPND
ncbi:MAG TPA: hypothetical protein VNI79_07770 [Sphingomicrobium sp.]|nr:hypothetical protein [Sphingomicrobium sp.]